MFKISKLIKKDYYLQWKEIYFILTALKFILGFHFC